MPQLGMRSFVLSFAILFALSLQAETPVVARPDSARQQQTIENVKRFAYNRAVLACTQAAFPGTAKTITMDFSGPHAGSASGKDLSGAFEEVFAISSGTQFEWDHWGDLLGKKLAVYRYSYQISGKTHAGLIYADENTGAISRMVFRGADAPAHLFCSSQAR
jgi:hypothetical protein